jgi:hypothetical protein
MASSQMSKKLIAAGHLKQLKSNLNKFYKSAGVQSTWADYFVTDGNITQR